MSDQPIPESVVAKIRKLLAMANDARGNENETGVAAEKAQALLTEYNLTLAELGDGASDTGDAIREKFNEEIPAIYDWQSSLLLSLAKNNFCTTWTERVFCKPHWGNDIMRWRNRQRLIGRRANVIVTIETYKYLVATMERLCPYTDKRSRTHRSWSQGCADRLVERLDYQRAVSEAESRKNSGAASRGDGTSLVLADVYSSEADLNNDLRFNYAPGTTAARRAKWLADAKARSAAPAPMPEMTPEELKKFEKQQEKWRREWEREQKRAEAKIDRRAYFRGADAGDNIGLDKQLKNDEKKRLR